MAPLCKFFQQGNCRYGDNCRFEHPGAIRQNANPFSVLGGGGGGGLSRGGPAARTASTENPYHLTRESILTDLTQDRPKWILSAYGPGRDAPEQLFGGFPREQSFEEIRMHFLNGAMSGNPQAAINEIDALYNTAEQQIQAAVNNVDGAMQFVMSAQNKHPNRIDICRENTRPGGTNGEFAVGRRTNPYATAQPGSNPFSSTPSQPPAGGFGQPSALGQRSNPFGGGGASAFGQPSQLGGSSAFGQPSQLGGGGGSALGQPSQPASSNVFGQTSQPAAGGAFGQSSQPATSSAFGQPSQLGGGSAFGKPSQLGGGGAFGQPSALGQRPNPFGTPAFGQPPQATASAGAFGQPSALGAKPSPFAAAATSNAPSPFASAANAPAAGPSASNPFGQKPAAVTSPFGQPSGPANPFAQAQAQANSASLAPTAEVSMDTAGPAATASGFGAPSAAPANPFTQASSGFGQPSGAFGGAAQPGTAAGGPTGNNPYGPHASRQHPPLSSYTSSAGGRLQQWKGKPVVYKVLKDGESPVPGVQNFDGSFDRIWFPDGPPPYYKDTEPAAAGQAYSDGDRALWEKFMQTGRFEPGGMPEAPPLREFCAWDI